VAAEEAVVEVACRHVRRPVRRRQPRRSHHLRHPVTPGTVNEVEQAVLVVLGVQSARSEMESLEHLAAVLPAEMKKPAPGPQRRKSTRLQRRTIRVFVLTSKLPPEANARVVSTDVCARRAASASNRALEAFPLRQEARRYSHCGLKSAERPPHQRAVHEKAEIEPKATTPRDETRTPQRQLLPLTPSANLSAECEAIRDMQFRIAIPVSSS